MTLAVMDNMTTRVAMHGGDGGAMTERERELGAIVLAYSDVTDRLKVAHENLAREVRRLSDELAAKNQELRRRERLAALGEMAAGLAHEVRNPLGGIALSANKLERELDDRPSSKATASRIKQAVRDLDRLVAEILEFAQEDRLERSEQAVGELLQHVVMQVEPRTEENGAIVQVTCNPPDLRLNCDPHRLGRVLLNLVMNGLQAAGAGGRVCMAARKTDACIEIEVSDNGPGISPEHLDRIFNPFFTTKSTGTGLGLAIAHRIIEAHGWTLRAANCENGGASFLIRSEFG